MGKLSGTPSTGVTLQCSVKQQEEREPIIIISSSSSTDSSPTRPLSSSSTSTSSSLPLETLAVQTVLVCFSCTPQAQETRELVGQRASLSHH